MDKPTNPRGPNDITWPEDSGSEQDFGASGVFKVVDPAEAKKEPTAGLGAGTGTPGSRPADPFNPPSFMGSRPLAEPTVHKVVLGGGAESSQELLDRMRMASQEKASALEKPALEKPAAAPAPGGTGGGGFTQLLRTLEVEMPSAPTASKSAPAPEPRPAAQDSGFTSLLRTMRTEESTTPPAAEATKIGPPATVFTSEEPTKVPPAPGPISGPAPSAGGFTELLRAAPDADPMMTYPLGARRPTVPPPAENKPGSFTQLFGSLGESQAPQTAPPPSEKADSSGGSAGSFTRMLSFEPQATPAEMPRFEENKPFADRLNYGVVPEPERPSAPSNDPFSPQPSSASEPAPIAPQSGGVGITRLIQMLDEPSKAPPPSQREAPPVSPATGAGPGVWTQTFASLSTSNDPPAPAAKAPDWAPPQAQPMAAAYPDPPAARPAPSVAAPAMSSPPAATGPSEFTRILDASRLREMAMKGGQGAAAEGAGTAPPPQVASPAPPVRMPSYPVPVPTPAVGMQGGGAMAHPAVYPPPVPRAPAMYAPTPHVPQAPGMQVPIPHHLPSAPPPPPAKPAPPAAGGLQQMVPILLIVVIVLLVVLIVTVIFLMKH
jgi:hypothetical protein